MPRRLSGEVQDLRRQVDRYLKEMFRNHRLSVICKKGLEPLYADMTEFVGRKGKRIRPLLFLMTYRTLNGKKRLATEDLIQTAAALELFHAFILVHDDVIDRSDSRRGKPTLHRLVEERVGFIKERVRTGINISIVMGDILFALACETIMRTKLPMEGRQKVVDEFLDCVSDTGVGEICDILHSGREIDRVGMEDIQHTYFLKTTKYTFECPIVIGAKLAGVSESSIQELRCFSHPVGLAFQIQNDLLEFQKAELSGKTLVDDLMEGKKTLLLRHAYDRVGTVDRLFLQTCFDAKRLTPEAIQRIRHLIIRSGSFRELQKQVKHLFDEAFRILEHSGLTKLQRRGMREILQYLRLATLTNNPGPKS